MPEQDPIDRRPSSAAISAEELLALAFDEAPQATIVTSPAWRVIHWGRAAQSLFGWTAQEAIGEVLGRLTGANVDDSGSGLPQASAPPADGGRGIAIRRHKDGRLLHVEVSWRTVLGETGAVRFRVATKRDVSSEQVRRDVALVDERYRDLLDSVPDAIVIVSDVGSIVLFNAEAARLFGVSSEAMIGQPVERLIPERFARGHASHRERFAAQPQRRPMGSGLELRGRRGDGSEFPVEVSLSPLILSERRFAMAALRDLSERVRIEEAQRVATNALQASNAKTAFLSHMSHELRTPLNAVLGFAQVLGIDANRRLDEAQRHQVAQILRAGRHLLAMMNDLLDVTRIESGALSLSVESVVVVAVVEEVVALSEPAADEAGVALDFAVLPIELCVMADRLRLRQVLLNLVGNAIKYNHRGGRVDIEAAPAGADVGITVRDTGVGLSADQQARLFRPFDRLGAEAGTVEGTGIGLVITRGLVQGMGGRVEVHSVPGRGSAFSVFLAAAESPSMPADEAVAGGTGLPAATVPTSNAPRRHLLYVEDNAANIELVEAVLALRPQWQLETARTGAQALESAARRRPDLALLDMHLPDFHGLELARRWDADAATAGIARVALSADATQGRARAAAEQGFLRYFTKPLDVETFVAWLDEFERRLAAD